MRRSLRWLVAAALVAACVAAAPARAPAAAPGDSALVDDKKGALPARGAAWHAVALAAGVVAPRAVP